MIRKRWEWKSEKQEQLVKSGVRKMWSRFIYMYQGVEESGQRANMV